LILAYSFTATARSRIEWLEEQIRRLSPDFNFDDGPKVDFSSMDGFEHIASDSNITGGSASGQLSAAPSESSRTTKLNARNSPGKRAHPSFSESDVERPFTDEARSVALDLGLLSLNTDSRQTHYLGTSSGRLFTSLIGVSGANSATGPPQKAFNSPSGSGRSGPYAFSSQYKKSCRELYELLKKVSQYGLTIHDLDPYNLNRIFHLKRMLAHSWTSTFKVYTVIIRSSTLLLCQMLLMACTNVLLET
jgi:hypothetical protein